MENYLKLNRQAQNYPDKLDAFLGPKAPDYLYLSGNQDALNQNILAFFCSKKCPGTLVIQCYQFICSLKQQNLSLISGFHSPMERECLKTLVGGQIDVIWTLGKSIESFQLPSEFERLLDHQKLLMLSVFAPNIKRINAVSARLRNLITAVLADEIFIPYAAPKSRTETFCKDLLKMGKLVLTLNALENEHIISIGALPIDSQDIKSFWQNS